MFDDYTDADRYDWDYNDSNQYCVHGKFIGSWAGPDILCQWCEDGISIAEMNAILTIQRIRTVMRSIEKFCEAADKAIFSVIRDADKFATDGEDYDPIKACEFLATGMGQSLESFVDGSKSLSDKYVEILGIFGKHILDQSIVDAIVKEAR